MKSCKYYPCSFDLCLQCINRDSDKMMDAPSQQPTAPQIWEANFTIDHTPKFVLLYLQTFKDGHIGHWDNQNVGSYEKEKERKIISVEGFVYGNAVSLTWVFEQKEGEDNDASYGSEDGENDYDEEEAESFK